MEQLSDRMVITNQLNELEQIDDSVVMHLIERHIKRNYEAESVTTKCEKIKQLFNEIRRLGVLQPLLDDDDITEIMINGYRQIYIEKDSRICPLEPIFKTEQELDNIIQMIVGNMDKKVNQKYPICDVRIISGARVSIVLKPVGIDGPYVTIRKFPKHKLTAKDLITNRTVNQEGMEFLERLVKQKYNLFVSGGTSSGKTTLLNVLSDMIQPQERVITIEDSAELRLDRVENLVRLETRVGDHEYVHHIPIKELIRASLRMRPDRIIVGEVRGEEAIDMLQAMNTGHDGSLSTGHGNSVIEMLYRLETMVLTGMDIPLYAIRQQISSALDIMVHIQKIAGRGRRIVQIVEVLGMENEQIKTQPLFIYRPQSDQLERTSHRLVTANKAGFTS